MNELMSEVKLNSHHHRSPFSSLSIEKNFKGEIFSQIFNIFIFIVENFIGREILSD
jgi:hypothetical protein